MDPHLSLDAGSGSVANSEALEAQNRAVEGRGRLQGGGGGKNGALPGGFMTCGRRFSSL
jgi:hypothetical protein